MRNGKPFTVSDPRAGRPRGARNKLAIAVLKDLLAVWNEPVAEGSEITKGLAALRIMAAEDPPGFAKLYASILPRELTIAAVAEIADDDLETMIERLQAELLVEYKVSPTQLEFKRPVDYVAD